MADLIINAMTQSDALLDNDSPREIVVSADLGNADAGPIFGHVDYLNPENGIIGWVVDMSNPEKPQTVRLLLDGVAIAECRVSQVRPHIAAALGANYLTGFEFSETTIQILQSLNEFFPNCHLAINIVGTNYILPSRNSWLLGENFKTAVDVNDDNEKNFDLAGRLIELRNLSESLLARPLRPSSSSVRGVIEVMSIDEAGWVWIAGWLHRKEYVDAPAAIVDRKKLSAGFVFTLHDRDDLDAGCSGFIGVLFSDWRPSIASDVHIYLGTEAEVHLRSVLPAKIIPLGDFIGLFDYLKPHCHTGHTDTLRHYLEKDRQKSVEHVNAAISSRAALEDLLVVPSFGCLAAGWALSPLKTIENIFLRIGSSILSCDRRSLSFSSRSDLLNVFPSARSVTSKAGFTAVFRGNLSIRDVEKVSLLLRFTDGSSDSHVIDSSIISHLGKTAPIEEILRLYPSAIFEPFFSDISIALRRQARSTVGDCRPWVIEPSSRCMIFSIPDNRSDIFLLFRNIADKYHTLSSSCSIVLVASHAQSRSIIIMLFNSIRNKNISISLIFVDDASYAFYALPRILNLVDARKFVYVDQNIYLTSSGWAEAKFELESNLNNISFFEAIDLSANHLPGKPTCRCFSWSSIAFSAWLATAPSYIGSLQDSNFLLDVTVEQKFYEEACYFSKPSFVTPLVFALNSIK